MGESRKVLVLGLDSAPELVFDAWRPHLPNLSRLMDEGAFGPLRSTVPPITVPAWMSMMTGRDPGRLGFYGFRNRKNHSYDQLFTATSAAVNEPTVWDRLSRAGKKVIVLGVPQTYPVKPVNGCLVSCFLTPGIESDYTWPAALKAEIAETVGEYIIDVKDFRTNDKQRLLDQIYAMTEKRFKLFAHLLKNKEWDFAMMVEMGTDRIQHGFWKYGDPEHRAYVPGSPWEHAILDYYRQVDTWIGEILPLAGDATILVVSDHGAKRMDGGFCLNEWLLQKGYLTLKSYPDKPTPIGKADVDWSRTRAWGEGGYYGRLFINVAGREPQGQVPAAEYEAFRAQIVREIESLTDHEGKPMGNRALKPADVYREVRNVPPDLILYFGDLYWRSVGQVGMKTLYTFENDTGPDDANHAEDGILIMRQAGGPKGRLTGLDIRDVASTVLAVMGEPVPPELEGKVISN